MSLVCHHGLASGRGRWHKWLVHEAPFRRDTDKPRRTKERLTAPLKARTVFREIYTSASEILQTSTIEGISFCVERLVCTLNHQVNNRGYDVFITVPFNQVLFFRFCCNPVVVSHNDIIIFPLMPFFVMLKFPYPEN